MEVGITKYKQSSLINMGDGLNISLKIGALATGGGDNSNIITINSAYSEGKELQKIFSIPNGHSVMMAVRVSCMGTTYTDLLRYSAGNASIGSNFYCDNIIYFTENRSLVNYPGTVCVDAKNSALAPTTTYTFKVLYASCGVTNITWYNNEFDTKRTYARQNERLTLKVEAIDGNKATTQKVKTDSFGNIVEELDLVTYSDFLVDSSACSLIKFSPSEVVGNKIYRLMPSEDGSIYFTQIPRCESKQVLIKKDSVVSFVFQRESEDDLYSISVEEQPIETYFTKEEVLEYIESYIELEDEKVVHLAGYEEINGSKTFKNYLNVAGYLTFRSGSTQVALIRPLVSYGSYTGSGIQFEDGWMILNHPGSVAEGDERAINGHNVWSYLNKADNNFVHKTGNETIAGVKTFSNTTKVSQLDFNDVSIWRSTTGTLTCDGNIVAQHPNAITENDVLLVNGGNVYSYTNSNFVHLSGNETIAGKKTFSSAVKSAGYECGSQSLVSNGSLWQTNSAIQFLNGVNAGEISANNNNVTSGGKVYSYVSSELGTLRNEIATENYVQVVKFTNYSGETIAVTNGKRNIVITASYGSTSVIDLTALSNTNGIVLDIVNQSGSTFAVKTSSTATKIMTGCTNCKIIATYDNTNWKFYKVAELTEV